MRRTTCCRSFRDALSQFLTPQVWKQAHQAWRPKQAPSRWTLQPLLWVAITMAWSCGDSQEERFAAARAVYVACHQRDRRPGSTLAGFLQALAKLPMPVLRALACGVRAQLAACFLARAWFGGFLPFACDGSRLECPRADELQRLGEAGKTASAPTMYLTALVLLPWGLPWSWCWGKGTASEHYHLRRLLPTLPKRALLVADAAYLGYELYQAILRAETAFLVRMSSRAELYTLENVPLKRFREGTVYYWPKCSRAQGQPPIQARLVRVPGKKADVWLLTSVLDPRQLGRAKVSQLYRWRWREEGMFRHYKHLLGKVKLQSRTVALVHREAETSMLALQLLLALAAQDLERGRAVVILGSPRQMLLRIRGAITAALRTLGPRQFADYRRMLEVVRSQARPGRTSAKVRRPWPRRKKHKPPKPPKLRVMTVALKARMDQLLQAG